MMVMPRPTARRAASSTTSVVTMPTVTSIWRGEDRVGDDVDVHRHPGADQDAAGDQRRVDGPADQAARAVRAGDGVDQETQHQDEAEVDRALEEQAQGLHSGGVELKQRQRDGDDRDQLQDRARLGGGRRAGRWPSGLILGKRDAYAGARRGPAQRDLGGGRCAAGGRRRQSRGAAHRRCRARVRRGPRSSSRPCRPRPADRDRGYGRDRRRNRAGGRGSAPCARRGSHNSPRPRNPAPNGARGRTSLRLPARSSRAISVPSSSVAVSVPATAGAARQRKRAAARGRPLRIVDHGRRLSGIVAPISS